MKKTAVLGAMACLCLAAYSNRVWAWWPLAHGLISVDRGSIAGPGYQQVPDIWSSADYNYWETIGVTDEFCWGHVCRRTYPAGELRRIVEPEYYPLPAQAIEHSPARHLRELFFKLSQGRRSESMSDTYRGWSDHNDADQVTVVFQKFHFDVAPGAHTPSDLEKWLKHYEVEWSIEKVAYVDIVWYGDPNRAFAPSGEAVWPRAPYQGIVDAPTGDYQSDGLICLAMKAFRKKGQILDTVECGGLTVQNRGRITDQRANNIRMSRSSLLGFTRTDYHTAMVTLYGDPNTATPPTWPEARFWRNYYDALVLPPP